MIKVTLVFLLLCSSLAAEAPWGKDADMSAPPAKQKEAVRFSGSPLKRLSELLILFHQKILSPVDGPRSHYFPSSSAYTLEAIRRYGFFEGFLLGCDRLLRENKEDWHYRLIYKNGEVVKWDPVPELER